MNGAKTFYTRHFDLKVCKSQNYTKIPFSKTLRKKKLQLYVKFWLKSGEIDTIRTQKHTNTLKMQDSALCQKIIVQSLETI